MCAGRVPVAGPFEAGLSSSPAASEVLIRPAAAEDDLWAMIAPAIRAGETYPLPCELPRADALAYWCAPGHEVFVALVNGVACGSYYLRANQAGGGAHVANCGYIVAPACHSQGIGRAMCAHSLMRARERGFRAMQFNFVISSNQRAVRLWESFGFAIVGRLPQAFAHPRCGLV